MSNEFKGYRDYGYIGNKEDTDRTFYIQKGQVISGYSVGIMLLT